MLHKDKQIGRPQIPYQDTEANLNNLNLTSSDKGCISYATDTDKFLYWDGDEWVEVGAGVTYTSGSVLFAGSDGTITEDNANFNWNSTSKRLLINGNIAIGTDTASYPFSLQGSGSATFAVYNVYNTTESTNITHGGVSGIFNYNGTGNTAGSYSGGYFDARYSGATNNTNGTGLRGFTGLARFLGAGTLTGAVGVYGGLITSGGGTITNGYTLYAQPPSISNSGTITNLYGCYINTQAATGVTNSWGLYQVSSLDNNYFAGATGIGGTPNASSILTLTSTTKALLLPRMTTAQRDAISSPIAGMVIYNTTTNVLNFHNGTAWGAV